MHRLMIIASETALSAQLVFRKHSELKVPGHDGTALTLAGLDDLNELPMNPALLTFRTCLWNATLRRPLSLLIFLVSCLLIWLIISRLHEQVVPVTEVDWEAEYEKMRLTGLKENMGFYIGNKADLKLVPIEWTALEKCPACFGTDMCDAIKAGEVRIDIPQVETPASKKGVYLGQWHDIPVAVKRLSNWYPKEFEKFDKFICGSVTGKERCNVAEAIVHNNSLAQQEKAFTPDYVHHAWQISYKEAGPLFLTYGFCATSQVIKMFSSMYDGDNDGILSSAERATLFTSMVVQPELLMLKGIQFQRLAPRAYGACGRLTVVEHGGRLLSSYLNASFSERAELAMQLLSLVQVLWHADRRWFALYQDFDYENFAVSHEREIYIVDYEELSIIENTDFDEAKDEDRHEEHKFGQDIVCNDDCFNGILKNLSSETLSFNDRRTNCQSLHSIGGSFMYSRLCHYILSDLQDHRATTPKSSQKFRGLLHSVPVFEGLENMSDKVEKALRECVHETKPGSRTQAVNDLSDLLAIFLKIA